MIRREKLHALILARKSFGEADRLLWLLTREYGLLRVVAKGVRKIPSRRGGHLEPLTHVLAIVNGGNGNYFLAGVEVQDEHRALRAESVANVHAQTLAHVPLYVLSEEEPHETLFDALYHAWQMLPQLPEAKRWLLEVAVTLHTLHCAGLHPDLRHCHVCHTEQPRDAVVLDAPHGGWHCLTCHNGLAGTNLSLSPRLLKVIRFVARYPARALKVRLTDEESRQVAAAMHAYVEQEVGRPVSSLRLPLITSLSYGQAGG